MKTEAEIRLAVLNGKGRVRGFAGAAAAGLMALSALSFLESCTRPAPAGEAAWLTGTTDERFATTARHLRGLDVAMVEIGYRYNELHWAGEDRNWLYARYQIVKIRTALDLAVERRPKRALSARMAHPPLAELDRAAQNADAGRFQKAMRQLTQTCITCHVVERVPFMHVAPPRQRSAPLVRPPSSS